MRAHASGLFATGAFFDVPKVSLADFICRFAEPAVRFWRAAGSRRHVSGDTRLRGRGAEGEVVTRRRTTLVLWLILPGLVGCTSGFPHSESPSTSQPPSVPTTVSVSPASVIVAAGSNAFFIAVFTPGLPTGGSLSWAVNAPAAGTISSAGMYTASVTPGNYTVTATWTPATPSVGTIISASATVQVLPVPQQSVAINPVMTQASGAVQAGSGGIQNAGVARQEIPLVSSTDSSRRVQVQSGFVIPVVCAGSTTTCP